MGEFGLLNLMRDFTHICYVVNDVEKTARHLADRTGLKPWRVRTTGPPFLTEMIVRGKKTLYSMKFARAKIGSMEIELAAPGEGDSIFVEHLKEKGEGFHHFGLSIPNETTLNQTVKELEEIGCEVLQSGRPGHSFFYYIDLKALGTILELCSVHVGTCPMPGEKIIS